MDWMDSGHSFPVIKGAIFWSMYFGGYILETVFSLQAKYDDVVAILYSNPTHSFTPCYGTQFLMYLKLKIK